MQDNNNQTDDDLRRLFKAAGPRTSPPEDMRDRVYDNTFAYWHEQIKIDESIAAKTGSWKFYAIAASLFVFGITGKLLFNQAEQLLPLAAGEIVFASGSYHIRGDEVETGHVANGALISTSSSGQLEIHLTNAVSLRMDNATSATIHSNKEVWLHHGRIYIDAQESSHSIRVVTQQASIIDIGTQFEIALKGSELSVAVREGRVDINLLDNKKIPVSASHGLGEVVILKHANIISRKEIRSTDTYWSWTHRASLPFAAGAPTAHDFLSWATREIGLELNYRSPLVSQRARRDILTIDKSITQPSVQLISNYLDTTATLIVSDLNENQLVIDLNR